MNLEEYTIGDNGITVFTWCEDLTNLWVNGKFKTFEIVYHSIFVLLPGKISSRDGFHMELLFFFEQYKYNMILTFKTEMR